MARGINARVKIFYASGHDVTPQKLKTRMQEIARLYHQSWPFANIPDPSMRMVPRTSSEPSAFYTFHVPSNLFDGKVYHMITGELTCNRVGSNPSRFWARVVLREEGDEVEYGRRKPRKYWMNYSEGRGPEHDPKVLMEIKYERAVEASRR
jgi:hypothetical protein